MMYIHGCTISEKYVERTGNVLADQVATMQIHFIGMSTRASYEILRE